MKVIDSFDLDAYLHRIGTPGLRGATLDTLRAVHAAHPAAIAFENLNPLVGWPVKLDPASIQQKLVAEGRGGWCFEHNALFKMALEALGFRVDGLGARVVWNAPPESPIGARSHMLLRVECEGHAYLADVGFGGNTLTTPLEWREGEQQTPHEPHRLVSLGDGRTQVLEAQIVGAWVPLYRFTEEPQFPADYEVSNWFLCSHESSFFRHTLLAARATPEAKYALRNTDLAIHRPGGTEKHTIASPTALLGLLANEFNIRLPEGEASEQLDVAISRIFAAPTSPRPTSPAPPASAILEA